MPMVNGHCIGFLQERINTKNWL